MDYLKVGKAADLSENERLAYRCLEILPGLLSWATLLLLVIFSYFQPIGVAVFIIIFDIYWLLFVVFLAIYLLSAYGKIRQCMRQDWAKRCQTLGVRSVDLEIDGQKKILKLQWQDLYQLIILPFYKEDWTVIKSCLQSLANDSYSHDKMIIVLAAEGRAGASAQEFAQRAKQEFGPQFKDFLVTIHPGDLEGELKGKGANQAWAAREVKEKIIDAQGLDYNKILVSVFDIDTIISPGYFHRLAYAFLTVAEPYRASYQPVPVYHNNIWQTPFFARVASFSNTFWQMMQQIRQEKLATYSSHSMTWRALSDIGFWSTKMVSEDSRIFFHCYFYYNGHYRVEPLYFIVSMDACADKSFWQTAINLYRQQRRWGWGVENVPYLIFNSIKRWQLLPKKDTLRQIGVQIYGFHSWATYAIIMAGVGWLPLLLGGDRFTATVLSANLPDITRWLMTLAMFGLVLSAILSTIIIPKKNDVQKFWQRGLILVEWICLPVVIVIFGAIPALEAQTRLIFGKYLGFWNTPKTRSR